eukprot:3621630-Rhodomonas_salina.3
MQARVGRRKQPHSQRCEARQQARTAAPNLGGRHAVFDPFTATVDLPHETPCVSTSQRVPEAGR